MLRFAERSESLHYQILKVSLKYAFAHAQGSAEGAAEPADPTAAMKAQFPNAISGKVIDFLYDVLGGVSSLTALTPSYSDTSTATRARTATGARSGSSTPRRTCTMCSASAPSALAQGAHGTLRRAPQPSPPSF